MTLASERDATKTAQLDSDLETSEAKQEYSAADRFMRKILFIRDDDASNKNKRAAHRNMRVALIISGIRCMITYVLLPLLIPFASVVGIVATPLGIILSLAAVVSGIDSLRRFWSSNHRYRWLYAAFIGVIFVILAIALFADISRLVGA